MIGFSTSKMARHERPAAPDCGQVNRARTGNGMFPADRSERPNSETTGEGYADLAADNGL